MLLAAADVPHHASRPALADPRAPVPVRVFQPLPPFPAPVGDHFVPGYPPHGHLIPAPALWYGSVAQRKAKKTWGERLRLPALPKLRERWKDRDGPGNPARMAINYGTKPPGSTYGTVTSQSALAKSMEYAEPWLYATYGRSAGAPPNPVRDLARTAPVVQAWDPKPRLPMPKAGVPEAVYEEIAGPGFDLDEFICACRAKLSASQRSRTKFVKDCKRCNSHGSARRSTTTGRNKTKGRSRPSLNSVLSSTEDPYSFMRKARLLTGTSNSSSESFHRPATLVEVEESSYQEFPDYISAKKNRFATVHSIRSGTKTRGPLPVDFAPPVSISSSEPAFTLDNTDDSRDSAYSRGAVGGKEPDTASQWDNSSFEEEFFDASDRISNNGLASPPRKSILECNVNAYDLMMRLGRSDFLGYDSGSDELSDNALQLEARSMPAKRIPKFTDYNKNEVLGGIRLRNGPPSYQLLSDGEGEEASSSSECTVNTSNNSSLYGIGTMSSNNSSTMLDESVDYVKMPNDDGVFKAPVPPPLPDRYPVKMSGEPLMAGSIPPPPPLPPPPPPMPLAQHGRDNSLNESDSSSTSGISDDSDAPKRPPRQKRDQPVVKRVSSCDSVSNTLVNPQDAVINQLKSILKKPPLQPVERSSVSVSRKHSVAEEPKEPAQLGRHLARRSESVDELETPSHDKQRKKKQVQFRSSADITVLSRDSMSDDFSEELESELESIFKRMKLSSRWGTQVATTAAVSAAGDEMDPAREEQDDAAAAAADADTEPGSPPGAEFNPCDEQHPALPEAVAVLEASASTSVIVAVSDSVVSGKVGVTSSTSSQLFRRNAVRRSLSDRAAAPKPAVFNDTMRLRLGTGRKTIIDVFSSVESTTTTVAGKDVPPASEELDNPAARKLAEYFSKTTLRRPKLPPPPPPPPRKAKANRVTVTLAEDAEQPGVNSSPVMVVVPAGDDAATVHTHESASSTDTNPVVDYRQLSSCPSDESQSKNVQAPTGGTASNPMSSSYGTSELGKGLPSSIMERYKGAAIRITTCGTIESPAEVVECDYTVSDSSHVGEGQEPGPTCITISATRRSCLSNILVIKNDVELPLAGRGACSILDEDLQKDLEEVEALYEEISEPIYEEVLAEDGSKSTAVEYELCLKRCLLGEDQHVKSLFDGASRDEILMYLEGVRDRAGLVSIDEDPGPLLDVTIGRRNSQNRTSNISTASDSSDDSSTRFALSDFLKNKDRRGSVEVERNDSGVGSETSKPSLTRRYQISSLAPPRPLRTAKSCEGTPPQEEEETLCSSENHTCEDCDLPISNRVVQRNVTGLVPLTCWKCRRRRQERKELIMEIVETEMKYGRDLQIIHEEFYRPMLVAGLLTAEQLAGVFLNLPELRDWNRRFTDRLRDALEIALEHGDEDLLTVNLGALFREAAPMLHAFETYCLRQGTASVLLNSLEKEKELLRIFLKVSQMENTLLRRMDLSSFLMVPVQRVTKYPLLLGRLYKVTPHRLEGREAIREAQKKIEAHLEHINAEAKEIGTTKLWRRISIISASSSVRRLNILETDQVGNIRLRKLALDILEWSAENVCFAMEGRLSFTQAGDNMWTRRGKNVKLTPTYALLVIRGNLTSQYNPADADGDVLFFARRKGIEQAALLLARERNSRYALIRDPLMLDKCIVSSDTEVEGYFEVHDHSTKDTLYFKAESQSSSSMWFRVLQYHCHSLGNWRRRRNALANIMIDGMGIDKSH